MFIIKARKYKPLYKKLLKLRENFLNKEKVLQFKREKWQIFIKYYIRAVKSYNKFKAKNQNKYVTTRFANRGTSFERRHRNVLQTLKKLGLFYGNLRKNAIKKQIINTIKKKVINQNVKFIEICEKRLDTVLYRARFCKSIRHSQQLIVHGKVWVNNKKTKTKSYNLKTGDLISIKPEDFLKFIKHNKKSQSHNEKKWPHNASKFWPMPPKHLFINYKTLQIILGDIKNKTNLSAMFRFNLNVNRILNKFV
jgi:ribosomal protein S4